VCRVGRGIVWGFGAGGWKGGGKREKGEGREEGKGRRGGYIEG